MPDCHIDATGSARRGYRLTILLTARQRLFDENMHTAGDGFQSLARMECWRHQHVRGCDSIGSRFRYRVVSTYAELFRAIRGAPSVDVEKPGELRVGSA